MEASVDKPRLPGKSWARRLQRPLLLVSLLLGVTGLTRRFVLPAAPPLPVMATVPAFTLQSEQGRPFGAGELRGSVWIANFVFTRCPTLCPHVTRLMAGLQPRALALSGRLHLVSFSVDPEHDGPAELTAYGKRFGADPRVWSFLTGTFEALRDTVEHGFKIAMGREGKAIDDPATVFHGTHFVLVDQEMRIRGYYDLDQAGGVDRLLRDAERLVEGAKGG